MPPKKRRQEAVKKMFNTYDADGTIFGIFVSVVNPCISVSHHFDGAGSGSIELNEFTKLCQNYDPGITE